MPKKSFCRKHGINSFCVRIRRTRAAIFQKATLATAAGGGRREQGLAPRSAIGEAACPPMTEPGTARGSQGFAFIRIRKGDATARWAVASWETLSRGFPMRRNKPHLCNLLSASRFIDKLRPRPFQRTRPVLRCQYFFFGVGSMVSPSSQAVETCNTSAKAISSRSVT